MIFVIQHYLGKSLNVGKYFPKMGMHDLGQVIHLSFFLLFDLRCITFVTTLL